MPVSTLRVNVLLARGLIASTARLASSISTPAALIRYAFSSSHWRQVSSISKDQIRDAFAAQCWRVSAYLQSKC